MRLTWRIDAASVNFAIINIAMEVDEVPICQCTPDYATYIADAEILKSSELGF